MKPDFYEALINFGIGWHASGTTYVRFQDSPRSRFWGFSVIPNGGILRAMTSARVSNCREWRFVEDYRDSRGENFCVDQRDYKVDWDILDSLAYEVLERSRGNSPGYLRIHLFKVSLDAPHLLPVRLRKKTIGLPYCRIGYAGRGRVVRRNFGSPLIAYNGPLILLPRKKPV